jgi:hypothetical protein
MTMTTAGHTAVSVARSLTRTRSVGRIPSSLATRRLLSSNGIPKESNIAGTTKPATPPANDPVFAKTSAGSGKMNDTDIHSFSIGRGPVSWPALGLVAITAASLVAYYKIERERRLEEAMGKIVSSESDGWSPDPEFLGKRKWKMTKFGWFPVDDAYGGGTSAGNLTFSF